MNFYIMKTQRPTTFSRWHRVKHTDPRHMIAVVCDNESDPDYRGPRLYFVHKHRDYLYDEYPRVHYTTSASGKQYWMKEIPARIVTHEVGDGVEDFLLDRVVLEAQEFEPLEAISPDQVVYSFNLYTYNLDTYNEPQLMIHPRSIGYVGAEDPGESYDIVYKNAQAQGMTNLYYGSPRQSPVGIINTDDPVVGRESVALVAPMTKFRKMRMDFKTKGYTVIVRSIVAVASVQRRRTWG